MYREPHLQKKSDECAKLWYEWYDIKYKNHNEDNAKLWRKKWCDCCEELSEMISQEVKTNLRYKGHKLP